MSQVEGLKKELVRVRAKARILEKLIELRCDVRDCSFSVSRQDGWKSPEGYPLAVSFEVVGGRDALVDVGCAGFVVYGSDIESIREAALFYGSTKYGANRLSKERIEDQSHIGRWVNTPTVRKEDLDTYTRLSSQETAILDAGGTVKNIQLQEHIVEVVGISPTWFLGDESPCNETMYVTNEGRYLLLSELQNKPDYNWENFDIDAD
jgi:hypothetical protein